MAAVYEVVTQALTATGSGTTDFTSSGFGTATAAIVIMGRANSTNNPQASAALSIGFWDGTSQCCSSVLALDALSGSTDTMRVQRNDYIAVEAASTTTWGVGYQASGITDGIRLTLAVDNSSIQRYCTVILIKGVSAKIVEVAPSTSLNGTATSPSIGFAPKAVLATCIGAGTGNSPNSGSTQTAAGILSFGAATDAGTHGMVGWGSTTAVSDSAVTANYLSNRIAGQVYNGTLSWAAEVTAWGSDNFTVTSRTAGSGSDVFKALALGGADLSLLLGEITTATSTGAVDTTTTGLDPDVVLLAMLSVDGTTLKTDSQANSFNVGISNGTVHAGYAFWDEDAAATSNNESAYSGTDALHIKAAGGSTMVEAAASMASGKFTLNYTTVSATARKGWYLAFGQAAGGGTAAIGSASGASTTSTLAGAATSAATISSAAGVSTVSTLAGAATAAAAVSAAAGASTTSTSAGASTAAADISAAAGASTAGTLTGVTGTGANIDAAAGVATASSMAGAATAEAAISAASGAATASDIAGASTAAAAISAAAGAATAGTLAGSTVGDASTISPAAGVASAQIIVGASFAAAAIGAATGAATCSALAGGGGLVVLSAPPLGHGPAATRRTTSAGRSRAAQLSTRTR